MMRQRHRAAIAAVLAGCLPLGIAAAAPAATNAPAGLRDLLPRAGEMRGFTASGSVEFLTTITEAVASDPPAVRTSDAANLINDGFRLGLVLDQIGTGKTSGAGVVTELQSPTAAAAYDRFIFAVIAGPGPVFSSAAQTRFAEFRVPGVPGARGVAEIIRRQRVADANVQWVEGSCLLQVTDGTLSTHPLITPVIAAAQAIHRRTHGSCSAPDRTYPIIASFAGRDWRGNNPQRRDA